MYETVVFDLDGTLLDTLGDLHAAVNAALQKFGLPPRSKDEVRSFVGNGVRKLMERAAGEAALPDFEALLDEFKRYYGAHCKDETKPYEGVLSLLSELKRRGVKAAVVSNKADFAVKLLAEEYFKGLVDIAVGEDEAAGIRKKPAPDSLLAVMERLGAERSSTVYVGDSEVDIETAKNAGVDCLSVTWGFKDEAFLRAHGATALIKEAQEILGFCKR